MRGGYVTRTGPFAPSRQRVNKKLRLAQEKVMPDRVRHDEEDRGLFASFPTFAFFA